MYEIISTPSFLNTLKKSIFSEEQKEEFVTLLGYLSESPFGYGKEKGLSIVQEVIFSFGKIWYDVDTQNQIVLLHALEI